MPSAMLDCICMAQTPNENPVMKEISFGGIASLDTNPSTSNSSCDPKPKIKTPATAPRFSKESGRLLLMLVKLLQCGLPRWLRLAKAAGLFASAQLPGLMGKIAEKWHGSHRFASQSNFLPAKTVAGTCLSTGLIADGPCSSRMADICFVASTLGEMQAFDHALKLRLVLPKSKLLHHSRHHPSGFCQALGLHCCSDRDKIREVLPLCSHRISTSCFCATLLPACSRIPSSDSLESQHLHCPYASAHSRCMWTVHVGDMMNRGLSKENKCRTSKGLPSPGLQDFPALADQASQAAPAVACASLDLAERMMKKQPGCWVTSIAWRKDILHSSRTSCATDAPLPMILACQRRMPNGMRRLPEAEGQIS